MSLPSASTPHAKRRRQWIWPVAMMAIVVCASARSTVAGPDIRNFDKVEHFAAYGLLATLICRLWPGWRGALWGVLVASAFGVSDEWHQSYVPGRSSDVMDWVADTLGAMLAVCLYAGWARYRHLLERPLGEPSRKNP